MHQSDSIDDIGGINWRMLIAFVVAWTIVYLCMMKGIKSSGKVMSETLGGNSNLVAGVTVHNVLFREHDALVVEQLLQVSVFEQRAIAGQNLIRWHVQCA